MSKKVVLIFPPTTDPRSPHLSLPSLAATLRQSGVSVKLIDADLEGFLYILKRENILNGINRCRKIVQQAASPHLKESIIRILKFDNYILDNIEASINCLRDPIIFFNPYSYMQARECIGRALKLISLANYPVNYNIGPIGYDVMGFDASKLKDLNTVTGHSQYNLFHFYYEEKLLRDVGKESPDVIGISIVNYQQVIPGLALARMLKKRGHYVVIGGTLYSKFVQSLLKAPTFFQLFCDGLIPYEGETALLELLEHIHTDKDFSAVPNFIHLSTDDIPTMDKTHIEDVNKLSTPDFDGLPLGRYLSPEIVLPILTGKGCYFNLCKFCDIPFINSISRKAYRVRTADRVANDIHTLHQKYGARFFQVTDESMSPTLLLNLAAALKDYPDINARFVGYARLEAGFTLDVCKRIYEMGVRKLFFGLESGSQQTLDHMKKGIDIQHVPTILRNCTDVGIAFHLFSIVGFPEETKKEAAKTLHFFLQNKELLNHPRNSFDIHSFVLDLRTEYTRNAKAYGIEIEEEPAIDFPLSVSKWKNANGMKEEEVKELIAEFHETLRKHFTDYRQFPVHLWPSFEEYSILYADHYEKKNFLYRFSLPPIDDATRFRFNWAKSAQFSKDEDNYQYDISCLTGSTTISAVTLKWLLKKKPENTIAGHFTSFVKELQIPETIRINALDFLRKEIDGLLSINALHLDPTEEILIPTDQLASV